MTERTPEERAERARAILAGHLKLPESRRAVLRGDHADRWMSADLAVAAITTALAEADAERERLMRFRPDLGASTRELSLSDIVFRYYRPHFSSKEAGALRDIYLAALSGQEPSA